jgi:hypothetical protein
MLTWLLAADSPSHSPSPSPSPRPSPSHSLSPSLVLQNLGIQAKELENTNFTIPHVQALQLSLMVSTRV